MKHEFLFHKGDTSSELLSTLRYYVNHYPHGVVVTVEPYCMPRSKEQNALYQKYIRRITIQGGFHTTDEVKAIVKNIAVGRGYPLETDEDGQPILIDGKIVPLSSAKATIGQMKILIETTMEFGLDNGIVMDDVKG